MESSALPGGRWHTPAQRAFIPYVLVSLVALQGCTRDPATQPSATAQSASALDSKGSGKDSVSTAVEPEYVPGQILVRFRKEAADDKVASIHSEQQAQVLHNYRTISDLQLVQVSEEAFSKALQAYNDDPNVLYAEPNYIVRIAESSRATPDDPRFGELWGLHNNGQSGGTTDVDLNMPEAWDLVTDSSNAGVITVIDTGVDYNHQDLAANMWTNPGEIAGNNVDDDSNGYVDDVYGINAITGTGNPMDDNNHGSHCAGTIAGRGNNATGVVGVNWNARIMGCKFLSAGGSGTTADAIECVDYVNMMRTRATNPVNIIASSNSWGGGSFSQALLDSIVRSRNAGILFIAAAGNSSANNDTTPSYPASYDVANIISVASHTRTDTLSSFSNFGRYSVHVSAPGSDILSTTPNNGYGLLSGTSMATPHVSGLAALLKAQDPSRDWRALRNLIMTGGVPQTSTNGRTLTGRRIRAFDTNGRGSLTCNNQVVASREAPVGTTLSVPVGQSVPIAFFHINCGAPAGTPNVTVSPSGSVSLVDDGTGGDQVAGDGLYAGSFTPPGAGTYTLTFPGGDTLTVTAQVAYQRASVPYSWRTITGTNLNLTDDSMANITSPFPIPFADGPGQTTLRVGMNGGISFNTAANIGTTNTALPNSGFTSLVAPHWDDLFPNANAGTTSGNVFWAVTGTAPNRELVIEWRNVFHFSGGRTDGATFQVVFFEGRSDILFNYQDVSFANATYDRGASATVGVQINSTLATQHSFNTASLSNDSAILWFLTPPGSAPEVRAFDVSPATLNEGDRLTADVEFTDPDGDTDGPWIVQVDTNYQGTTFDVDAQATFTAEGPNQLTLPMFSTGSNMTVAVRVVDARRATSDVTTAPTLVTVTDVPPAVTGITAPAFVNERQATTFSATLADPGADSPWRVEWDFNYDGTTFTTDVTSNATLPGRVSANFAYPDDGTYTVAVRATDKDNVQGAVATLVVQVRDLRPLVASFSGETSLLEGQTLRLTSSFTDPTDNSGPFKVQWDLNYDGLTFDVDEEQIRTTPGDLSFTRVMDDAGALFLAVRVVDADGSVSDVRSIEAGAAEVSPVLSNYTQQRLSSSEQEPVTVAFRLSAASGSPVPAADEISMFLWDFDNDGSFDYGTTAPFVVYRYTDSPAGGGNTYTARVQVRDEDTFSEATVSVTVENAPPTLANLADQQLTEGDMLLVQASATDPGGDALSFGVFGAPEGMTITQGGLLSWRPSAAQASPEGTPHTITLTVTDEEGSAATRDVTFTVFNAPPRLVYLESRQLTEGSLLTVQAVASDPGGNDRLRFFVDGAPEGLFIDASGQITWLPTHAQGSVGGTDYTFNVNVMDDDGAIASQQVTYTVLNVPPTLAPLADRRIPEGTMLVAQAVASDPGRSPLTFSLEGAPAGMSIDSTGLITWAPTYAQGSMAGTAYTLTVSVADDDGATASRQVTYTVRWLDNDGDGMADTWERANGLNPSRNDAAEDADGDGVSNLDEFLSHNGGPVLPDAPALEGVGRVHTTSVELKAHHIASHGSLTTVRYQFQVFADQALTHKVRDVTVDQAATGDITSITLTDGTESPELEDLEDDHAYSWRVRATDGSLHGPWSTPHRFAYDPTNDAPTAPRNTYPLAGTQVSTTRPTFSADNAADVDEDTLTYVFELAEDAAFTTGVLLSDPQPAGHGSTSWAVGQNLRPFITYYWRVHAKDPRGGSTASAATPFSVFVGRPANREPGAPALAEPSGGTTVTTRSPTLVANAATDADGDALSYVLEVDTLASFGSPARQASTALAADAQGKVSWQPTTALAENTRYFWRARASDGLSASDWTVGTFFVDSTNDAPSAPVALNPSDAVVFKLKPTLTVQNATDPEGDAISYTFEVRNADGAVVATGSNVAAGANGTTSFTPAEDLQEDGQYTWTARGVDARGAQGAASAEASFKVDSAAPVPPRGGCSSVPGDAGSLLSLLAMVAGLSSLRRRKS